MRTSRFDPFVKRSDMSYEISLQLERLFALVALMSFHILMHYYHMGPHHVPAGNPLLTRFYGTLKLYILMYSESMFLQIIFGAEILSALGASVPFVRFGVVFHVGHGDKQAASWTLAFLLIAIS